MEDSEPTSHFDAEEERLLADLKSSLGTDALEGAARRWVSTVPLQRGSTLTHEGVRAEKTLPDVSFTTEDWPIADYEPLRACGRGAFGQVWIVRDRAGVLRALKMLDLRSVRRHRAALRELEALRQYCALPVHAHRISVFHIGQTTDCLYYTMELADDANTGEPIVEDHLDSYVPFTLKELLRRSPPDRVRSLDIVRDLLTGLSELHQTELAHRDVKPENVVFVGGQAKLADIGMTTPIAPRDRSGGTPGYMPPDMRTDATADTYAMSKVLFELLAWPEPVRVPWVPAALRKPGDVEAKKLNDALVQGCAPQGDDRYADAAAMAAALEKCTAPVAAGAGRHRRRLTRRTAVGLLATAAGMAAAFHWWPQPPKLTYIDFVATAIKYDDERRKIPQPLGRLETLHLDDMIFVFFRTSVPAHVYVFLSTESGADIIMYPLAPALEDRPTKAGQWLGITPPGEGFKLEAWMPLEGKVRLYVLASDEPLTDLTETMRRQIQTDAVGRPIKPPRPHHVADELRNDFPRGGRFGLMDEKLPREFSLWLADEAAGSSRQQPERARGRVVIIPYIDFNFARERHPDTQPTEPESEPPIPIPIADEPASIPDA